VSIPGRGGEGWGIYQKRKLRWKWPVLYSPPNIFGEEKKFQEIYIF